jgi:hypothetical protein
MAGAMVEMYHCADLAACADAQIRRRQDFQVGTPLLLAVEDFWLFFDVWGDSYKLTLTGDPGDPFMCTVIARMHQ